MSTYLKFLPGVTVALAITLFAVTTNVTPLSGQGSCCEVPQIDDHLCEQSSTPSCYTDPDTGAWIEECEFYCWPKPE